MEGGGQTDPCWDELPCSFQGDRFQAALKLLPRPQTPPFGSTWVGGGIHKQTRRGPHVLDYSIVKGAITPTPTQAGLRQSAAASDPHRDGAPASPPRSWVEELERNWRTFAQVCLNVSPAPVKTLQRDQVSAAVTRSLAESSLTWQTACPPRWETGAAGLLLEPGCAVYPQVSGSGSNSLNYCSLLSHRFRFSTDIQQSRPDIGLI